MIEKIRQENRDNPNYPVVYWATGDKLYVKIGDVEETISPEDALNKYGDNILFLGEFNNLIKGSRRDDSENEDDYVFKKEMEDNQKSIEMIEMENDEAIASIIDQLRLSKSDDVMEQLRMCCLVHHYIATHNKYQGEVMDKKATYRQDQIRTLDLYNAVVRNNSVCTSNSIEFQEILSRIGIHVECVGLTNKENGAMHMANLVEIGGQYYYFDTTLERSIYETQAQEGQDMILCCAGLGSEQYNEYYNSEVVVSKNPLDGVRPLPSNISLESIPHELVNSMIQQEFVY